MLWVAFVFALVLGLVLYFGASLLLLKRLLLLAVVVLLFFTELA